MKTQRIQRSPKRGSEPTHSDDGKGRDLRPHRRVAQIISDISGEDISPDQIRTMCADVLKGKKRKFLGGRR